MSRLSGIISLMKSLNTLLAKGLAAGYAGKTKFEKVLRGTFEGEESELSSEEGVYLDQWFASLRGGGQELAENRDGKVTRLYAGGTIDPQELSKLGITQEQVSKQLKKAITQYGLKTRLDTDCLPDPDGDWRYTYKVIKKLNQINLTIGLETITYREHLVFAHGFLNSPIK